MSTTPIVFGSMYRWVECSSHSHHGWVVDVLWRTNVWVQLLRLTFNLQEHPLPLSISSYIVGSSLSSHTLLLVNFTSWIYLVQNPRASSMTYPIAMLPSNQATFLTYPFRAFMYCSIWGTSTLCVRARKDQAPLLGGLLDVSSHQSMLEGRLSLALT